MTRHSPRAPLRGTAGGLAAGLLAAGSLALGAPARAAGPEFTLGGPAATALYPHPADGGPARKSSLAFTVDSPVPDGEPGGYRGDVTVTFDLSGVMGFADVSAGPDPGSDCEVTGATAVCRTHGVPPGLSALAGLDVAAAEGSEHGVSGTVRASATADGATFVPFAAEVTIGGPDLVMKPLAFDGETEPGDVQPAPITFTNTGTRAADGVLLTLRYSRGLELPERYANCAYTGASGNPGDGAAWSTALCSVPGTYEPGATYTLGVPLSVEVTERAYDDTFVYRVHEDGAGQRPGARLDRGSGRTLTLKQLAPAARGMDLTPGDNQREARFRTRNSADFVAYGTGASGARGETVAVRVGFRNEGPAWIGHPRSGEGAAAVDFTVPDGAAVTAKPGSCRALTAGGDEREEQLGAPRYVCDASTTVYDGADFSLPFDLRITEPVPDASGTVTVRGTRRSGPGLPFDPEPANNTARMVLNADAPGSEDAGGTSDGSTATGGSSGSSGAGGSTSGVSGASGSYGIPGTSGGSGASGTSGSTSAPGTSGPSGAPGPSGGLASTGSAALAASGAAGAAVVTGGVLYATARRRTERG